MPPPSCAECAPGAAGTPCPACGSAATAPPRGPRGVRRRRGAMPGMRIGRCGRQSEWAPWPPCPMSAMVSSGRGSTAGTGARSSSRDRKRATDVAGARGVLGEDREGVPPGSTITSKVSGSGDAARPPSAGGRTGRRPRRPSSSGPDADVEVGHRCTVDETQAHLLTGTEKSRPVAQRRGPVYQVGGGMRVGRRTGRSASCACVPMPRDRHSVAPLKPSRRTSRKKSPTVRW